MSRRPDCGLRPWLSHRRDGSALSNLPTSHLFGHAFCLPDFRPYLSFRHQRDGSTLFDRRAFRLFGREGQTKGRVVSLRPRSSTRRWIGWTTSKRVWFALHNIALCIERSGLLIGWISAVLLRGVTPPGAKTARSERSAGPQHDSFAQHESFANYKTLVRGRRGGGWRGSAGAGAEAGAWGDGRGRRHELRILSVHGPCGKCRPPSNMLARIAPECGQIRQSELRCRPPLRSRSRSTPCSRSTPQLCEVIRVSMSKDGPHLLHGP